MSLVQNDFPTSVPRHMPTTELEEVASLAESVSSTCYEAKMKDLGGVEIVESRTVFAALKVAVRTGLRAHHAKVVDKVCGACLCVTAVLCVQLPRLKYRLPALWCVCSSAA